MAYLKAQTWTDCGTFDLICWDFFWNCQWTFETVVKEKHFGQ